MFPDDPRLPADDIFDAGVSTGTALCRSLIKMYDTARLRSTNNAAIEPASVIMQRHTVSMALRALLATSVSAKEAALEGGYIEQDLVVLFLMFRPNT